MRGREKIHAENQEEVYLKGRVIGNLDGTIHNQGDIGTGIQLRPSISAFEPHRACWIISQKSNDYVVEPSTEATIRAANLVSKSCHSSKHRNAESVEPRTRCRGVTTTKFGFRQGGVPRTHRLFYPLCSREKGPNARETSQASRPAAAHQVLRELSRPQGQVRCADKGVAMQPLRGQG